MSEPLRRVATGLKLVYYSVVLLLVAVGVGIAGMCVLLGLAMGQRGGGGPPAGMAGFVAFAVVFGGLVLVANVLGIVGKVLCVAVPGELGAAKRLIVTAVVLEVGAVAINGLGIANTAAGGIIPPPFDTAAGLLNVLFSVTAIVLFLLFARSLAAAIREPGLAGEAMSVLWVALIAIGCYVGGIVVTLFGVLAAGGFGPGGPNPPAAAAMGVTCVGGTLFVAALVFAIVSFFKYLFLLGRLSTAAGRYARDAADDEFDDHPRDEVEEDRGDRWGDDSGFDFRDRGGR